MSEAAQGLASETDLSTLASALVTQSALEVSTDSTQWLAAVQQRHPMLVEQIPLKQLARWQFRRGPLSLVHESGRFFSIEGIRTTTNYGAVESWDQPIINQPEIGILGILTRVIGGVRYYLMQAKLEPGNVSGPQVSPTLQATLSNYKRAHGGRAPRYLEYFLGEKPARVIVDQVQSEQGSRFLRKRNRNVILEVQEEIEVTEDFRWLTFGEIKDLLQLDNVVNMDTRSVMSCIAFPTHELPRLDAKLTQFGISLLDSALRSARSVHTLPQILSWLAQLRASYRFEVVRRGLDELNDWVLSDAELSHQQGRFFSVIGARVEISGREVEQWMQPLLYHRGKGLNGMIMQKINGVLHFLIRACFYPGNHQMFELGPTVSRSDYERVFEWPAAPPFLDLFREPAPQTVRYSSVQSEEGGRFFQYQNQYVMLELPPDSLGELPAEFVWMTLGQIQQLLPQGLFTIEARNLLACLKLTSDGRHGGKRAAGAELPAGAPS